MKDNYKDIRSRINEEPTWYDYNGVPRYGEFKPDYCPNIYANVVGLFEIQCQSCQKKLLVEMHDDYFATHRKIPPVKWQYGDPPRHDCVGDTMNSDSVRVVEFWVRGDKVRWVRRKKLEGPSV